MEGSEHQATRAGDAPAPASPTSPPEPPAPRKPSFFKELHRRGMFKTAASYVFAAFAVMGGAEVTPDVGVKSGMVGAPAGGLPSQAEL